VDNYDLDLQFRIARGYMEMLRYREARELFVSLHDTAPEPEAEEALSLAFQCSMQILPWDRAFALGTQYMEQYPSGEYFDFISLAMGQLYARRRNWPDVIRHLTETLEKKPRHSSAAECMYLIGYASFMEERFADAVRWLRKMTTEFPQSELVGDATYWTGMALMFDGNYRDASVEFDHALEQFGSGTYAQDAAFRRAVCSYGMTEFEDSAQRLAAFMGKYPESALLSEAAMMRGDIAGVLGQIREAVAFYRQAMADPKLNIEFYNHAAFQAGNILYDDAQFDALVSHFTQYIREKREGCNIPQAIYWIGRALWDSGEREGALRYYRRAVELYGKSPASVGIDMILDEWVGRIKRSEPDVAESAWREMRAAMKEMSQEENKTLELRFKRVLLLSPYIPARERLSITNDLQNATNIVPASPAVLQQMMDIAQARGNREFALKVAQHVVSAFPETDYALDARMVLAQWAVDQARQAGAGQKAAAWYEQAIAHLNVIRSVFAASGQAAEGLDMLGSIYRDQKKYKEADACYTEILGVKAWRNLWPEALYGRGECAYAQRQYDAASAYYERIYVLYSHFREITAKAYLRRAECLRKMFQDQKAREVLEEMLANTELAALPEIAEARALSKEIGGGK
jgi:TolA-binding protein